MTELGLSPVTGRDELDRTIRWVVTTDLLDPGRYLSGGELVLTGLVWRQSPEDSERFVRSLVNAGVSALGAGDTRWGEIPGDLVEACRRHRMPLFHVPQEMSFAEVTEHIVRRLSAARAYDMTAVLDRHRRLVAGATAGAGLDPLLHLLGHDLGMPCWVLTPAGRVVAGSHPLPEGMASLLARGFLTAKRMPCALRGIERSEAGRYSVFPVDEQTTPGSPTGSWPSRAPSRTGRRSGGRWPGSWRPWSRWSAPGWTTGSAPRAASPRSWWSSSSPTASPATSCPGSRSPA
nr:hypothetical protein GCM10020093_113350 [Planobispora longispora]